LLLMRQCAACKGPKTENSAADTQSLRAAGRSSNHPSQSGGLADMTLHECGHGVGPANPNSAPLPHQYVRMHHHVLCLPVSTYVSSMTTNGQVDEIKIENGRFSQRSLAATESPASPQGPPGVSTAFPGRFQWAQGPFSSAGLVVSFFFSFFKFESDLDRLRQASPRL
jgi:hypothetical protein